MGTYCDVKGCEEEAKYRQHQTIIMNGSPTGVRPSSTFDLCATHADLVGFFIKNGGTTDVDLK